jgi:hypothetical protein
MMAFLSIENSEFGSSNIRRNDAQRRVEVAHRLGKSINPAAAYCRNKRSVAKLKAFTGRPCPVPLQRRFAMKKYLFALSVIGAAAMPTWGADWPNWLGPNRNGSSPETGLLTTWPKAGPKVLWKVPGGDGYSTVAVANGQAITQVQHDGSEFVLALDAVKGTKLWETKVAAEYKNSFGDGPRATPTIEGKSVYIYSPSGTLACLETDKGDIVWSVNLLKEFGGKKTTYGLSASRSSTAISFTSCPAARERGSPPSTRRPASSPGKPPTMPPPTPRRCR